MTQKFEFSPVPGFFQDYSDLAPPRTHVKTQPDLGIIPRSYNEQGNGLAGATYQSQWTRLANHIKYLNERHNPDGEYYKLVYLIRHGTSVHNVKMAELKLAGRSSEWNDYWGYEKGDGEREWFDAELVGKGIAQAEELAKLWDQSDKKALPLPETVYTSPLARCLETTKLIFKNILGKGIRPVVKEGLRERLTGRPCDARHPPSWIKERYPDFEIEQGFPEANENWKDRSSESIEDHEVRVRALFEDIFTNDKSTIISFTTHSYAISSILAVINHTDFWLEECGVAPLFVKAVKSKPTKAARAEQTNTKPRGSIKRRDSGDRRCALI
ncbi:phosphoglycerate mutase-like protein [Whalleya microplaca]|nr:phosphoglycerate mutase-like protein [Whalleya microplaca]